MSRTKLRHRFRLPPSKSSVKHGNDKRLRFGLRSRRSPMRLNSLSTGHARSTMLDLTHAPATLDLVDLTPRPLSISPSSLSSLSAFHSASLWLWVYLFIYFTAIWVDLMVVVGCGLWAVTVAVVVGCGGDGRWWLSVSLMIMGWDNILF